MVKKVILFHVVPEGITPSLDDVKECVEFAKEKDQLVCLEWIMFGAHYSRFISKEDDPEVFYNESLPKIYGL